MQQSQHTLGDFGGKIVYIDIKKEGGQDRSLEDAISQMSKPASLAISGDEGEAFISDKLKDHPSHVIIRQNS